MKNFGNKPEKHEKIGYTGERAGRAERSGFVKGKESPDILSGNLAVPLYFLRREGVCALYCI